MDARNADQVAYWNGEGGLLWTARQEQQDRLLVDVSAVLYETAQAAPGEQVIDIGCGCGDTTIALARQVGDGGSVTGIDVSEAMLARARARTAPDLKARYVFADATDHAFPPVGTDLLASRFGVMFFGEPVRAFENLRRALKPGGRLAFVAWRALRENPWALVPLQAAFAHVPAPARPGPETPGPFSFADPARVQRILEAAGFSQITIMPRDLEFDIGLGQGVPAAAESLLMFGPVSGAMRDQPAEVVAAVKMSIVEALRPYERGGRVGLKAAIWAVTARNA
jgi:SAM-dependent methyltransferase